MKIIDVEQGSPEWLLWRKTVITATDCPAIRGSSPWSTAYKCWQKKLGLAPEQPTNAAMERGKTLEPILRDRFFKSYSINMTPYVVESTQYDFLGASLDGLSNDGKYILEIKTGGHKLYAMALKGEIPAYYMDQMQHQLLVTGAEKCFYMVGSEDESKDIIIEVFPDGAFAANFLPEARAFWKCVAYNEPPILQDSDYKDMNDEPVWRSLAKGYLRLNEEIKGLEVVKENYRKELLKLCNDQSCLGEGIKVIKQVTRGRVVYDDIPQIKDLDLEPFRKPSTIIWKIVEY